MSLTEPAKTLSLQNELDIFKMFLCDLCDSRDSMERARDMFYYHFNIWPIGNEYS